MRIHSPEKKAMTQETKRPVMFKETEELWTRFIMLQAQVLRLNPKQENNKKRIEAIQGFLNAIEKILDAIDDSLTYGESL